MAAATDLGDESDLAKYDRWLQILTSSDEISKQASEAQRRSFTLEEMQKVENLILSILRDVQQIIAQEMGVDPDEVWDEELSKYSFSSTMAASSSSDARPDQQSPTSPSSPHHVGVRKKRGRPPIKKPLFCAQCGTRETPEWRRGEDGPNTLCNGCGLRYAKKKKWELKQAQRLVEGSATDNSPPTTTMASPEMPPAKPPKPPKPPKPQPAMRKQTALAKSLTKGRSTPESAKHASASAEHLANERGGDLPVYGHTSSPRMSYNAHSPSLQPASFAPLQGTYDPPKSPAPHPSMGPLPISTATVGHTMMGYAAAPADPYSAYATGGGIPMVVYQGQSPSGAPVYYTTVSGLQASQVMSVGQQAGMTQQQMQQQLSYSQSYLQGLQGTYTMPTQHMVVSVPSGHHLYPQQFTASAVGYPPR
eukprot:TRINITY_DN939_c0_g1_i1.p1 TRINITY_DN939_c0_g1~~TRINITY_DN939_c0_g1_i1.p1  ORF type:complete len:420 (-),score=81.16 TRINITY_DN939_c0_g1_i1:268-1527(-)